MGRWSLGISLIFLLLGCARIGVAPQNQARVSVSAEPRNAAMNLRSWVIIGALGVKTPKQGVTANFTWDQTRTDRYTLDVSGPIGSQHAHIQGENQQVTLQTGSGKTVSAKTPEALLTQQLGWYVPVQGLYYWVRGIPAPGVVSGLERDADGRLSRLQQAGWQIEFQRYAMYGGLMLPTKLRLQHGSLWVRLVVREWRLL